MITHYQSKLNIIMWTNTNSPRVNPRAPTRSLKYLPPINRTPSRSHPLPVNNLRLPNRQSLPPINATRPRSHSLPVNNLRLAAQSPKRLPSINAAPHHVNPWAPAPSRHSLPPINATRLCSPPLPVNNLGTAFPNRHLPGIPLPHTF